MPDVIVSHYKDGNWERKGVRVYGGDFPSVTKNEDGAPMYVVTQDKDNPLLWHYDFIDPQGALIYESVDPVFDPRQERGEIIIEGRRGRNVMTVPYGGVEVKFYGTVRTFDAVLPDGKVMLAVLGSDVTVEGYYEFPA